MSDRWDIYLKQEQERHIDMQRTIMADKGFLNSSGRFLRSEIITMIIPGTFKVMNIHIMVDNRMDYYRRRLVHEGFEPELARLIFKQNHG